MSATRIFELSTKTQARALENSRKNRIPGAEKVREKTGKAMIYIASFGRATQAKSDSIQFFLFLIGLCGSETASPALVTGAIISLIASYSESPAALANHLCSLIGIDQMTFEVNKMDRTVPVLKRKEVLYEKEMGILEKTTAWIYEDGDSRGQIVPLMVSMTKRNRNRDGTVDGVPITTAGLVAARIAVIGHLMVLSIKAATNSEGAESSEGNRMQRLVNEGLITADFAFVREVAARVRANLATVTNSRKAVVKFVMMCAQMDSDAGIIPTIGNTIAFYIRGTGLTSYLIVKRYGINTRLPGLATRGLTSDLNTFALLMAKELKMGVDFMYRGALGDPTLTEFSPGQYPLLYSYAIGVAGELDKSIGDLQFNNALIDHSYMDLGRNCARETRVGVDSIMAKELGLTEAEINFAKRRGKKAADEEESDSGSDSDGGNQRSEMPRKRQGNKSNAQDPGASMNERSSPERTTRGGRGPPARDEQDEDELREKKERNKEAIMREVSERKEVLRRAKEKSDNTQVGGGELEDYNH